MDENSTTVPTEVKGWNWGAFIFNIFWGIGNKTYLPLLCLIPGFNLIWMFVCGFKGNEWAWKDGDHNNIETFKAVQATWNRAGLVYFIITITFIVLYVLVIGAIIMSMPNSNSY